MEKRIYNAAKRAMATEPGWVFDNHRFCLSLLGVLEANCVLFAMYLAIRLGVISKLSKELGLVFMTFYGVGNG